MNKLYRFLFLLSFRKLLNSDGKLYIEWNLERIFKMMRKTVKEHSGKSFYESHEMLENCLESSKDSDYLVELLNNAIEKTKEVK